jgi:hypothetical protein
VRRPGRLSEPECRAAPEPFGGGAVAEDELRHCTAGLDLVEPLRNRSPGSIRDRHPARRLSLEVPGPVGIGVARRDEQASIRLLDEPDGDGDLAPADPPPGEDPDDLPPAGELLADLVRQRPPRCQDLPSVATEGA